MGLTRAFAAVGLPKGIFLHQGHSWALPSVDGRVKIGLDEFLSQSVGHFDRIDLSRVGIEVEQGATDIAGDQASFFFAAEILLGGVLSMVMLFFQKVRMTPLLLVFAQFLVVLGMVFNRMNVAVTSFQLVSGEIYVPNWMEIVPSLAIVAIGFAAFAIAVRYLKVFDEGPISNPIPSDPYVLLRTPKTIGMTVKVEFRCFDSRTRST